MRQHRVDRTADAIALLARIAKQNSVDVKALRSKGFNAKSAKYVKIRRDFCVRGRAMDLTTVELAIALNRNHSTIIYHSSPDVRAAKIRKRPQWKGRTEEQRQRRRLRESKAPRGETHA